MVLQDACYDHKYARPKTTAAQLADIVERPERLAATVLGVACAQVRLGKSQLQIIKTDRKGSLSDPEVQLVHANSGGGGGGKGGGGKAWPERLGEMLDKAGGKVKRGECEIPAGMPRGDLYLNDGSRGAMEGGVGAVYEAVDMVMREREGEGEGERVKRVFVGVRPPGKFAFPSWEWGVVVLVDRMGADVRFRTPLWRVDTKRVLFFKQRPHRDCARGKGAWAHPRCDSGF